MIANEDQLLRTEHDWYHALGLGCLHALVDEDRVELEPVQPRVASADAGAANHVSCLQQFLLRRLLQQSVTFLVDAGQLPGLVLQLLQLLQLGVRLHVLDLIVESEEADWRVDRLARLCAKSHDLQVGLVYLLGQLVHGRVRGSAHQHGATILLH